jgi:hypothetical protein
LGGQPVTIIPKIDAKERNAQHSNLLLASFGAIYDCNQTAAWYFLTEDDTILVPDNLEPTLLLAGTSSKRLPLTNIYMGNAMRIVVRRSSCDSSWAGLVFLLVEMLCATYATQFDAVPYPICKLQLLR